MIRILVLAGLLLVLAGCTDSESPEQQVRDVLTAMQTAVESGSVIEASELLDPGYRDLHHPNKRAAARSLFAYTRRHRNIHLFVRIQSVDVAAHERSAEAVLQVAMTAEPADSTEHLLALKADLYRFEVQLVWNRDEEAWRIASSTWRRANLASLVK